MIVSGLVVPPLYLRVLGDEQFGLFAFLILANSLLMLFELGFSRAVSHEFAATGDQALKIGLPSTLRTTECFFVPVGILLSTMMFFFAEFIVPPETHARSC